MKKIVLLLVLLFALSVNSQAQIVINEIMASNGTTIADEDGDFEDWIELFNYSNEPVNLLGFGLSDDYARPFRWVFPDVTIQPGEFLLVWASNKNRTNPNGELHTNFAISASGEEILLTAPNGVRMDEIPPIPIPRDISYGRFPDGADALFFFDTPTPGSPNTNGSTGEQLETPSFSIAPGFYPFNFFLEISHTDPNVTIFYTLDGTEPDENSFVYSAPIEIKNRNNEPNAHSMIRTNPLETDDRGFGWTEPNESIEKATILKAIAKSEYGSVSEVVHGTWFVDNTTTELPVLSIITPIENFYDQEIGIYVPGAIYETNGYGSNSWGIPNANYHQRGVDWERPISLEWFEHGDRIFQQNLGVRIHGGGTRALPMKSLRLYARGGYGDSHIRHQIFERQRDDAFKRLILRNSGQDFYNNAVMFRDAFIQELISGMNIRTQDYRPSIVYINGEFWGIHNIRERFDKHFFERVYQVEEHDLDYLSNNREINEGSTEHYDALLSFIENNPLSVQENFEVLSQYMDIENYTDYIIANTFVRNTDWPGNNVDFWRYSGTPDSSNPEKDGRWRWIVYDTDFGFGLNGGWESWNFNMLEFITNQESETWPNPTWSTFIIRSLFENENYRQFFTLRYSDLLNFRFISDSMVALIEDMAERIAPDMPRHINRWGYPNSMNQWDENLNLMKEFAIQRPEIKWQHLKDFFDFEEILEIELTVDGIGLKGLEFNTKTLTETFSELDNLKQQQSIQVRHFKGLPFTLTALAWPGFEVTFSVNGEFISESTFQIIPEENMQVVIHLQEIENAFDNALPKAFTVNEDEQFLFDFWSPNEEPGTFPNNMAFVFMDEMEPGLDAEIAGFTTGAYNLESRTRINGEDEMGFCFINTGNETGNPGFPGIRLGGALLGLETRDIDELYVSFTGWTKTPNSREYHLRLQYRVGDEGPFMDVLNPDGSPVEYQRNETEGHSETIGPLRLPSFLSGKPYIQLMWRYYHTGVTFDENSGARSQMCIADILVEGIKASEIDNPEELPQRVVLMQNYPNPFNPTTTIRFLLEEPMHAKVSVFTLQGRRVAVLEDRFFIAGEHHIMFDASHLSSGLYIYLLEAGGVAQTRKMLLIK